MRGSPKPPDKPVEPPTPVAKRVPIEDPEDEGPQDGVQIQSTRGRMDQAAILVADDAGDEHGIIGKVIDDCVGC